jgi:hypothetical protein
MTHVFAEFEEPGALVRAIEAARAWGQVRLEAYMPYHVPEIEKALAVRPSRLPLAVLAGGLGGAAGAYGLQWLLNAYDYPLDVGGRPPHMPLAYVPITFEMGVLFAAFTAVVAVLIGARMMRLWYPSCEVAGIESATGTRFWLEIASVDAAADVEQLVRVIEQTHPAVVRRMEIA